MSAGLHKLMHDYQRSLCYKWEDKVLGIWQSEHLDDAATVRFIASMCRELSVPMPDVRFTKQNGGGTMRPESLSFTSGRVTLLLIVHEFAHYTNPRCDSHGPQFMANYIKLAAPFVKYNEDFLANSAAEYGLCVMRTAKFGVHRLNKLGKSGLLLEDL